MTTFGDMYYEGKEYEIIKSDFKPGRMSTALRTALGINETSPPPWLYNMQRYGPPPAYPNLKIPGVNMVISLSEGGNRFFQDENGNTIYADCHGLKRSVYQKR
jgi:splicing factor 3B subunit 2